MRTKVAIKVLICSIMVPLISLGIIIFSLYLFQSDAGLILGIILAMGFMIAIVAYGYPVWFKDYIKEYWKKQDAKNEIKENN